MAFFGPGGLTGRSEPGLDPQLMQALLAQFPGLQGLQGQPGGQEQGRSLQSLGYQWPGPTLQPNQGAGSFALSPFEGASGVSPESITGGLASGTFGKSGSQSPLPNTGQGSLLSLPSLQLPMAQIAATQGGYGGDEFMGGGQAPAQDQGYTINAGDVLGAGQQALDLFAGPSLGTQTTTPGYAEQRAGERDLSTLGGSFLPSYEPPVYGGGSVSSQLATQLYDQGGSTGASVTGQLNDALNAAGETMYAPGGADASQVLGPQAPSGDLLGGGLSTLQGLYNIYGGTQTGDIGQLLSGGAGTLGGLGQMAPETMAALSQSLGLGAGGLGLAAGGLGGLAGGYGLYQGIQQGDPLQALMGAGGLYAGLAPIANYALSTSLPTLSSLAAQGLGAVGAGTGAATGGAAAGAGAAAGGLGAGLTAGIFAAPIAAGLLGGTIEDMVDAEAAMRRERARQQRFERGLPTITQDIMGGADLMSQLTPEASNEQLADAYSQLLTVQRNWEGGPGTGNPLAPSFPAMIGGMSDAGRTTREQLDPYLAQVSLGQLRAEDLMRQRGMAIPGGGGMTPESAATLLGGASSAYDPESGSFLGMPSYRSTNPWIQQNLLDPSRQRYELAQSVFQQSIDPSTGAAIRDLSTFDPGIQAQLQGIDMSRAPDYRTISAWSPEAQQAFAGIQPGTMEASVRQLLGLPAAAYGSAFPVQTERYGALNLPSFAATGAAEQAAEQQTQQALAQDPVLQQLEQYIQQMQGFTQQSDPIMQAIQQNLQGAPVSSVIPQQPGAPGFTSQAPGGGGMDLMALLRQLGYAA